jgi:hypothetical protein
MKNVGGQASLFKITYGGETRYYQTKDFGGFLETVRFLGMVNRMCDRNPDAVPARIMLMFSDEIRFTPYKRMRMLQEIDKEAAIEWVRGEADAGILCHMVGVDYDADAFTHTDLREDPAIVLAGSLSGTIGAYKAATYKKNSTQTGFHSDRFVRLLEDVLAESTLDAPEDFLAGFGDESPDMGQRM